MLYKYEIQNMLRQEGVIALDSNKTIFGIATIGLLVGKERLEEIIHDNYSMEERKQFEGDILLSVSNNDYEKVWIIHEALELISKIIDGKMLARVTETILQHDLLEIVLYMNIFDYDMGVKDYLMASQPISCVSWINDLVVEILKVHGGKTLLNADCGTGDFLQQISVKTEVEKVTGYTFMGLTYTIAKIRGYFSFIRVGVKRENMLFYPVTDEKYDMAYNSYPLIYKYDNPDEAETMVSSWNFRFDFNRKYSANLLWILNTLQSVKENGTVVAFVANGVLVNEIDRDIRKYLVENNYISAIISLPLGILPFSNVASSLIILRNGGKVEKTIRMINATEIHQRQRRYSIFSDEDIAQIINLYITDSSSDTAFNVPYEDIVSNNYHLGIGRYIETGYTMINPCMLENVTRTIFRGYQIKASEFDDISTMDFDDTEYRIINVSDIHSDGYVERDLQAVVIDDTRKFDKYCVKDGDIIITAKNTTIKTAVFREEGKYKAILTGNLIAIRPNKKKMNPYFLKAFLDSELGEALLKSIQTGTTVFSISPNSLKKLVVSLPSMELQTEIADEYIKTIKEIEDLMKRYHEKSAYLKEIYKNKTK